MLRLSSVYRAAIRSRYAIPLVLTLFYSAPTQALGLMEARQHALTHDWLFRLPCMRVMPTAKKRTSGAPDSYRKSPMTTASRVTIPPLQRVANNRNGITPAAPPVFPATAAYRLCGMVALSTG